MRRLLPYFAILSTVKMQFSAAVLCGVIFAATSGFGLAAVLREILYKLSEDATLTRMSVFLLVLQLPALIALRALCGFFNAYLITVCGLRILEVIRMRIFEKLQKLHLAFFDKHTSGDLLSRTMNDTQVLQKTITDVSNDLIIQPATLIASIAFLTWMTVQKSSIAFLLLFLLFLPICILPLRYFARRLHHRARQLQQQMASVTEFVRENLNAIREVRAFTLEDRQARSFLEKIQWFFILQVKVIKYLKAISPSIDFITSIGIALAIYYSYYSEIGLDEVVPLAMALHFAYNPVKKLGVIAGELRKGIASIERIEEVLDEPVSIENSSDAFVLERVSGKIEFHDVSFSYGDAPVLSHINCSIAPSKCYALVGPSGAGKSTFINLILRFYDVTSGSVSIDGHDLRKVQLASLRNLIALVDQTPVLLNDTIYNNILVSRPSATQEEVYQASKRAFAHDFTLSFEKGYETLVGERSTRLSGGQVQRISLARAFLKDAPIIILDAPTSALDSDTETVVQMALEDLVANRTVILIAHRPSTIRMVDEILVFETGQIVDHGNHEELLDRCQFYRNIYERQLIQ